MLNCVNPYFLYCDILPPLKEVGYVTMSFYHDIVFFTLDFPKYSFGFSTLLYRVQAKYAKEKRLEKTSNSLLNDSYQNVSFLTNSLISSKSSMI